MITKLVGVRIKQLRAEQKLSQVDFAGKIGMARSYFAEVETGKRNVSMRNLIKIVDGLEVTLEEFFDSELFDVLYEARGYAPTKPRAHYAATLLPSDDKPADTP